MVCITTLFRQNRQGSHGSNHFLCLIENLGYIHCNHYNPCRTMNTTQEIQAFDSESVILESGLESLLKMTNDVVMKLKQQTMEMSL